MKRVAIMRDVPRRGSLLVMLISDGAHFSVEVTPDADAAAKPLMPILRMAHQVNLNMRHKRRLELLNQPSPSRYWN